MRPNNSLVLHRWVFLRIYCECRFCKKFNDARWFSPLQDELPRIHLLEVKVGNYMLDSWFNIPMPPIRSTICRMRMSQCRMELLTDPEHFPSDSGQYFWSMMMGFDTSFIWMSENAKLLTIPLPPCWCTHSHLPSILLSTVDNTS